jgi:hypothetical protein
MIKLKLYGLQEKNDPFWRVVGHNYDDTQLDNIDIGVVYPNLKGRRKAKKWLSRELEVVDHQATDKLFHCSVVYAAIQK